MDQITYQLRVFIAGPAIVCWGFERLLQGASARLQLGGTAHTTADALDAIRNTRVDVAIVDLDAGFDVPALCAATKCIGLTGSDDVATADAAVLAGARGIVRKNDPADAMLKAIAKVHDGELWIDRGRAGRVFMEASRRSAQAAVDPARALLAGLTAREREALLAVANDAAAPGKVLARRLRMSEHTLRNHLSSIYGKLGLANRLDLYAWAVRHQVDKG